MNNKEYKAIVKKAVKRFERLQELELKDSNGLRIELIGLLLNILVKINYKNFSKRNC